MTERCPQEEFLRELTRERFSRPVREWHDTAPLRASSEQIRQVVQEVVPYRVDEQGVAWPLRELA